MRFMIVIRNQHPVALQDMPPLVDGFVSWWDHYRDKWLAAGFFPGADGGGGICEVADEVELHKMMQEWPFAPFSRMDIYPLVDMDVSLSQWKALLAAGVQSRSAS
jgi:hypothetical protein